MGSRAVMAVRQAHNNAATKRTEARQRRDAKTKAITEAWKTGFAALKKANDDAQKERDQAYNDEMQLASEQLADELEGAQE